MQVFSGSSNQELAEKIAKLMGTKLGEMEISQFANGETRIWIKDKVEKQVVVVQSLSTPTNEHLMEFCLICDALHRGGASEITAVIPWMGYSKQDKVFRVGEPLSAKVVAQIIQTAKIAKIITVDLHNRATLGFFDCPIVELSAKSILRDYFAGFEGMIVAPDAGSVKGSCEFAEALGVEVAYVDKVRDRESGKVMIRGMSGNVKGKGVLIVDDNIFTGQTLLETTKYLRQMGAGRIRVAATHHLYVSGVQEKLENSEIDEIVVSDTVARGAKILNSKFQNSNKSKIQNNKLKILSVAQMIVDELR